MRAGEGVSGFGVSGEIEEQLREEGISQCRHRPLNVFRGTNFLNVSYCKSF